jgi:hypothetical protein
MVLECCRVYRYTLWKILVDATGQNPSDILVHAPIRHVIAIQGFAPGPSTVNAQTIKDES